MGFLFFFRSLIGLVVQTLNNVVMEIHNIAAFRDILTHVSGLPPSPFFTTLFYSAVPKYSFSMIRNFTSTADLLS